MQAEHRLTSRRLTGLGVLTGLIVLLALAGAWYAFARAPFELGRARWSALGRADYSLVVTHYCGCDEIGQYYYGEPTGQYRITVRSGRVTRVQALDHIGGDSYLLSPPPAEFDSLTVEAMLRRAAADQPALWPLPWLTRAQIDYDPRLGYVTSYVLNPIGWNGHAASSGSFDYYARDLVLGAP